MGSYLNLSTGIAAVALVIAVGSLGVLRWRPHRKRSAGWMMGGSLVVLWAACACAPARESVKRALNAFVGSMVTFGAAIPVLGMYMTGRWFRETLAEARGYAPMEVVLAVCSAAVILVLGAAAVILPLSWLIDHLPGRASFAYDWIASIVFTVAGGMLLKLGGSVGTMARRLASLTFFLICATAEVGLWWALRQQVPEPFLNVATATFLAVTVGGVWSSSIPRQTAEAESAPESGFSSKMGGL